MLATSKTDLLKELKRRVEDKILEPTNYELLKKLIVKATDFCPITDGIACP